jgi:hypothetical protein
MRRGRLYSKHEGTATKKKWPPQLTTERLVLLQEVIQLPVCVFERERRGGEVGRGGGGGRKRERERERERERKREQRERARVS